MGHGLGETLRQARTRRRIELAEVAEVTKIRVAYLRAIEGEEWARLPGEAYARAFVRTYGDFLGLDGAGLARGLRGEGIETAEAASAPEQLGTVARSRRGGGWRRRPVLAGGVLAALAAVLAIALLSTGGGGGGAAGGSGARREAGGGGGRPPGAGAARTAAGNGSPERSAHTISLTATGEVWVCLLDGAGRALLDGRILAAGSSEGPYRSGNFTLSLGNGEVMMMVDGKQASIPQTPDPVGYEIDRGTLRPLGEGERPTCT